MVVAGDLERAPAGFLKAVEEAARVEERVAECDEAVVRPRATRLQSDPRRRLDALGLGQDHAHPRAVEPAVARARVAREAEDPGTARLHQRREAHGVGVVLCANVGQRAPALAAEAHRAEPLLQLVEPPLRHTPRSRSYWLTSFSNRRIRSSKSFL